MDSSESDTALSSTEPSSLNGSTRDALGDRPTDAGPGAEIGTLTLKEDVAGGLGRHLGIVSTTFLIIGRMVGTGIFSTPSSITNSVGSVGAALLLWVFGLAISFAGLFVWLELGCMFPRSGGEKVYLEATYRRPKLLVTVVFSVQAILLGFTATACIVFATNILLAADRVATEWEARGIAIVVMTVITLLHIFTPKASVRIMNAIGSVKIFVLLFIVATGWVVLSGKAPNVPNPGASFHHPFEGSVTSSNPYATALFKVLNSFAGWSNAAYVLNEVKRPVRTLKIAGPLALATCGLLYILANVSYFSVGTPQEIAHSGITVASFFVGRVFGATAERILSVFVAISAFGNVMTVTFTRARLNQELAKEGVVPFPRFWASTWPVGSPSAGLLLHWIPSFVVIAAIPFGDAYNFIIDLEGYPGSILSFFVVLAVFLLRFDPETKHLPRPFRVPLPIAGFFMVGQTFLLVAPFLRPPGGKGDTSLPYWLYAVVGTGILFSGVVYWVVWMKILPYLGKYELQETKTHLRDGTVVTVFEKAKYNLAL
ncbi:high affinity methionine permease [Xylona heveae TC161]|uniref:High affinity methionine permease n=1 Tax=Xylona heveae (strain CBS 132557 / TC161) TaxID=1328760 RepID=A0A164ZWB1_XYLHT|nr:high affinity methionine permease [Xylona heveae TC161]KZF19615.1 high affinity methionine permease [Xylona heveae TC161]